MLRLNNFHKLRGCLIISALAKYGAFQMAQSGRGNDIIYKEKCLYVWWLRKLFVILQRFFAPQGSKMPSKRLIAWAVKGSLARKAN